MNDLDVVIAKEKADTHLYLTHWKYRLWKLSLDRQWAVTQCNGSSVSLLIAKVKGLKKKCFSSGIKFGGEIT